jgi:putative ATP-dependent endonuclease of the OLD family
MKLVGIEIKNYRSIGTIPVVLNPLTKCNILIGANNSGKSNVLRAVNSLSALFGKAMDNNNSFSSIDIHKRDVINPIQARLHFEWNEAGEWLQDVMRSKKVWFDLQWVEGSEYRIMDSCFAQIEKLEIFRIAAHHLGYGDFNMPLDPAQMREVMLGHTPNLFKKEFAQCFPYVRFIPEFRQIRDSGSHSLSGDNLVELLCDYQHPAIGQDINQDKFNRIEGFVRRLLHLPEARLEISHKKPEIIVTNNGLRLPLTSYGTGVHELVILVTGVLAYNDAIYCIEEPEIHLHPRLQREFLDFIKNETKNTYLISTHSPAFINYSAKQDGVQLFHLHSSDEGSTSNFVKNDSDCLAALRDLGVNASDLLQANAVIWVEGPSDRIYINRWLELAAPELKEGIDYSIMFYGGRLLSHISLDRDEFPNPDDLIPLLRVNQHSAIIIDSDRRSANDTISDTKERIRNECKNSNLLCWITQGREIENYLSSEAITAAYGKITGEEKPIKLKEFKHLEGVLEKSYGDSWKKIWSYDRGKPARARQIVVFIKSEDLKGHLKANIDEIITMIKAVSR